MKVIGFLCTWCAYAGADRAGSSHLSWPGEFLPVRVSCSARVEPELVMEAFSCGADGVMILACHPGDCHYKSGAIQSIARAVALTPVLSAMGIDPRRFRVGHVGASEGERFAEVVREFVREIESLGPATVDM